MFRIIRRRKTKVITTRGYHNTSIGKDVEQLELSFAAGGNIKWYNHFGKQFGSFLKS